MSCLVLDAMGVIFEAADDVAELLIPFVVEQGDNLDQAAIEAAYLEASLGQISSDDFWHRVGLSPGREDDYLSRHRLTQGIIETMTLAVDSGVPVWCLSNDVGRWSQKLRERLGVDRFLQGAIISGDLGLRKPDPAIYQALLEASGYQPQEILFVDDRDKNIAAARTLGIDALLLDSSTGFGAVNDWIERQGD